MEETHWSQSGVRKGQRKGGTNRYPPPENSSKYTKALNMK